VPDGARKIPLVEIFRAYSVIGLQSVGGGVSGWVYREIVQKRQWLTEEDFFSGLTLAQAMPGVNVINLAIWIGSRLRGGAGVTAALLGLVGVPIVALSFVAALYHLWHDNRDIRMLLAGTAMAALGMSLSMGVRTTRRAARQPVGLALAAAAFIGVGILRLPLVPVALVLAVAGVLWAYLSEPR
jgi:chromate transporter